MEGRSLGFVGDGATDNAAAMGNLFALTGSQRVFLPPGTYVLSACPSQWLAASSMSLVGAGQGVTTIKFPPGCTIGSTGGVFAWIGRAGVAVRNLTIDLNNAVASPVGATPILQFNGTNNVVVDHVSIINGSDHELLVSLVAGTGGINGYTITNNYLALATAGNQDNQCLNVSEAGGGGVGKGLVDGNICVNTGMLLTGSWSSVTNNDVSGSRFGSNIAVGPSATTDHWTIANNRAHDSGTGQDSNSDCQGGFEIWAAHATITGNIAYNNGSDGIMFGGPHDSVVGNLAWNNGTAGLNNGGCGQNGFHANYSSPSINAGGSIVSGNQAWDDGTGTQKYGYADNVSITAPITLGPNSFAGATAPTNIVVTGFGTAWSTAAYGRGAGADPAGVTTAFGAKDDFWAQVPATTGKTGFYALEDDYATSFARVGLLQHGSADTGTTDGINNANLGVVDFQNETGLIRNNGASPIKVAIAGTVRTTTFNGFQVGLPTGGDEGAGTLNIQGAYYANGTVGVTCSGAPTASFAVTNGIVTHC